jgi:hypothetical protein
LTQNQEKASTPPDQCQHGTSADLFQIIDVVKTNLSWKFCLSENNKPNYVLKLNSGFVVKSKQRTNKSISNSTFYSKIILYSVNLLLERYASLQILLCSHLLAL